jgi:ribose 5-phosphate isomerase B
MSCYNKKMFTILLGCDHAGFELKETIRDFLSGKGYEVDDMGAFEYEDGDDYPILLAPLAVQIAQEPDRYRGIVIGGSGQGEAMICNRFPGVRAAVYYGGSTEIIELSRQHNNANVLSLGARFLSEEEACEAVELWLQTEFSNDARHLRRNTMLDEIM